MSTHIPLTPPTWGEGVRAIRTIRGLSQVELAEKASVPQSSISRIENGSTKVSDSVRVRIANALGVDPHELFPYLVEESA